MASRLIQGFPITHRKLISVRYWITTSLLQKLDLRDSIA
jgi:hypothetical protein